MDVKIALGKLGLKEKEMTVYLAVLELGASGANSIAKKAGIQRTTFYDLANKMVKNGFLKKSQKGKVSLFFAVEPEDILNRQKQDLEKVEEIIPQIKAINNLSKQKPKVYYYEGSAGIESVNEDILKYKGEYICFSTPRFLTDHSGVGPDFVKKRVGIGRKLRAVCEMDNVVVEHKKKDNEELREVRMLPKNLFHSEIEMGVHAEDRTYIANYKDKFALIIEDKEVASVLKQVFELVWDSGKIINK